MNIYIHIQYIAHTNGLLYPSRLVLVHFINSIILIGGVLRDPRACTFNHTRYAIQRFWVTEISPIVIHVTNRMGLVIDFRSYGKIVLMISRTIDMYFFFFFSLRRGSFPDDYCRWWSIEWSIEHCVKLEKNVALITPASGDEGAAWNNSFGRLLFIRKQAVY